MSQVSEPRVRPALARPSLTTCGRSTPLTETCTSRQRRGRPGRGVQGWCRRLPDLGTTIVQRPHSPKPAAARTVQLVRSGGPRPDGSWVRHSVRRRFQQWRQRSRKVVAGGRYLDAEEFHHHWRQQRQHLWLDRLYPGRFRHAVSDHHQRGHRAQQLVQHGGYGRIQPQQQRQLLAAG